MSRMLAFPQMIADQDTFLFWDQVHLTTKAHAILAEDIHRVINGLESSFN